MNKLSIKNAWKESVARLPVEPQEIQDLVYKVAQELVSAAAPGEEPKVKDPASSLKLPHGVTMEWEKENNLITGVYRAQFDLILNRRGKTRTGTFLAQVGFESPLEISDPDDPTELITWTEANGPQKAWIVDSLRKQVVDFLGADVK